MSELEDNIQKMDEEYKNQIEKGKWKPNWFGKKLKPNHFKYEGIETDTDKMYNF